MTARHRIRTAGLMTAGVSFGLVAPAGAQEAVPAAPVATAAPVPTATPVPTPAPAAEALDLGTFTVEVAPAPTPAPTRRTRKPRATATPTPTATPAPTPAPSATPAADAAAGRYLGRGTTSVRIPDEVLDAFAVPPFLLPIYQAAAMQYGVRWELLAAINEIETDAGRRVAVSSAGALGWMQFMPATWKQWGVDANRDGLRDPYNPADAIFAAARYLRAAGAQEDVRRAVFAYNHADWYVDDVLARARRLVALPTPLVDALTGLAQGRMPVAARATVRRARGRRPAATIRARGGASVIAVSDAKVLRVRRTERERSVTVQDAFGNVFTYSGLGRVATTHPVPRAPVRRGLRRVREDDAPTAPASRTRRDARGGREDGRRGGTRRVAAAPRPAARTAPEPAGTAPAAKRRLFANPARPSARKAGGDLQLAEQGYAADGAGVLRPNRRDYRPRRLRRGSRVLAGTVLGRIAHREGHRRGAFTFTVRPGGRTAPAIDPRPILRGYALLERTAVVRDGGRDPLSLGQVLLLGKDALQRQVLGDPRIGIYAGGRQDIRAGAVDRRVLATLAYLADSGLEPTVSSLRSGHGYLTASGNVSEHSSGNAVDIAAVNGVPILGHQGAGSITEQVIGRLLGLQGTMAPHQIISLMTVPGEPSTLAMADHNDHVHVGFRPGAARGGRDRETLAAKQWRRLGDRLTRIDQPEVRRTPSRYAVRVRLPRRADRP